MTGADLASLAATVRDLADRQAILDCIMREARGRDRQDIDLTASCWWPDGIDEHGPIITPAPDYPARANAGHARFFSATMHHITTHTCEIDGDMAHCESYVIGTMLSPDKQSMKVAPGRYFDRLERRPGPGGQPEWRLLYRRCTVEMSLDGPADWVNGPMCKGFLRSVWSREDKSYQRPIEVGSDGERW
ncbi:nuclear transport factor 2 family protein [Novosphingobium aerophilum]|uniref:Nuclear transport factor 2 family protein n=1 Tax=Novosphingobium aerophilum TaxID=2839843 RepID=A0A7X1F4V1_9SPHN|nr:nuclear transport factor 2 family protein [Novosphingobium aerophilum]MBC2650425.1 nuclear transport factor 2 family protein [Novosphingobium aerophilum]